MDEMFKLRAPIDDNDIFAIDDAIAPSSSVSRRNAVTSSTNSSIEKEIISFRQSVYDRRRNNNNINTLNEAIDEAKKARYRGYGDPNYRKLCYPSLKNIDTEFIAQKYFPIIYEREQENSRREKRHASDSSSNLLNVKKEKKYFKFYVRRKLREDPNINNLKQAINSAKEARYNKGPNKGKLCYPTFAKCDTEFLSKTYFIDIYQIEQKKSQENPRAQKRPRQQTGSSSTTTTNSKKPKPSYKI